jgi:hypothetical protein
LHIWRYLLACFVVTTLGGCGGGGGSGGAGTGTSPATPNSRGTFSIALQQSSVDFSFHEGRIGEPQVLTANITGSYEGELFAAVLVQNNGAVNAINPLIALTLDGSKVSAVVNPSNTLPRGTYTGRLVFLACSDAACRTTVGGTPLSIPFAVKVMVPVQAEPAAVMRTVVSGTGVVQEVTVVPGEGEAGYTIVPNPALEPYVQISNIGAGGFRISLPSMPSGTYGGTINLAGSLGSRTSLPIEYTVSAPPGGDLPVRVATRSIALATTEQSISAPQFLGVTQPSWQPGLQAPDVLYQQGQGWLQLAAVPGGYEVRADAASLSAGAYAATIVVRSNPVVPGTSLFVTVETVSVAVTVGQGLINPADVLRTIDSETTAPALSGTVPVNVFGGPQVTWNAASDMSWLTVSPSGATGTSLTYSIDPVWLATAENYMEHVAHVTLTAPGTVLTSRTFAVRITPQFAELTGAGARVQLTGQATELVVAGRGFAALTNLAQRVTVAGATPSTLQRINDNKLLVRFSGLAPGQHAIAVGNALNRAMPGATIVAVDPVPYAYAAVPSGGKINVLTVDHERGVLYGVDRAAGVLRRFQYGSATWSVDAAPVTGAISVGVLRDGRPVVTAASGRVHFLDRDTLASNLAVDLICHARTEAPGGLPVTLDGRLWLGTSNNLNCAGSPLWGRLGFLDPVSQAFVTQAIPGNSALTVQYADGPDLVASRNGERLIINQHLGAPFPGLAYLDASESIVRPTPPDTQRWLLSASASDSGQRVLIDALRVIDEQFGLVGRIELPSYVAPMAFSTVPSRAASIISPDGNRTYVLTYRDTDFNQPTPINLPRVYVVDSSTVVGDAPLPVLGFFELADFPSCLSNLSVCSFLATGAISLDGTTLFIAGSEKLIVAPIPSVLSTQY